MVIMLEPHGHDNNDDAFAASRPRDSVMAQDNGHSLLSSRDDQGDRAVCTEPPLPVAPSSALVISNLGTGRTPLFYAERAGRTGLAYHLRRVGGHKSKQPGSRGAFEACSLK